MREAGATAAQELAFTLADAIAYVEAAVARGLDVDDFAGAAVVLLRRLVGAVRGGRQVPGGPPDVGDGSCATGSGRSNPRSMGLPLPRPDRRLEPDRPVGRQQRRPDDVQALAAVLGGAQSLHTNSRDEALALPTEEAARLALRTQQILAYEAGVTETPDPLAGSYYVETLTNELEAAAWAYLDEIDAMGGTLAAIEGGFQQRQIQESAYRVQRAIESGDQVVVGVNRFRDDERRTTPPLQRIDPDGERRQVERRPAGPGRASTRPPGTAAMDRLEAAARGDGQPAAADHRGRAGLRDGRRDQRPPAGRLGRAPRADHGLTPSGIRQWECQRPSPSSTHQLDPASTRRANGRGRARLVRDRLERAVLGLGDRQMRDDDRRMDAAVRRVVREALDDRRRSSRLNGAEGSGSR